MKRYEVFIKDSYSRGRYGKEVYFSMILVAISIKEAELRAAEILRDMSYGDFFSRCTDASYRSESAQSFFMCGLEVTDDHGTRRIRRNLNDKVSADHKFTIKAKSTEV